MTSITNATIDTKANIYFDGKVVSHTVHLEDGTRKTLGLIYPGTYHFATGAPENMLIISGSCSVILDDATETLHIEPMADFNIPGDSGFTITVGDGICEYICSFLA